MSKRRFLLTLLIFFVLAYSGCTPNLKSLKEQSESNRIVGEEYLRYGNYTQALKYFLQAEAQYADDPDLQNNLGLTYMAKKRLGQAVVHFKKAISLKSDFSNARNNLGVAYSRMGAWDDAIAVFLPLTEDLLYATPHYPHFNLGWAYYNKLAYDLSEKHYLRALEINPKYVKALRGLGLTYIAMGKGQKAAGELEKAIALAPATPLLYFDLAKAHAVSKNRQETMKAYRKVIELSPDSALAESAKNEILKIEKQ